MKTKKCSLRLGKLRASVFPYIRIPNLQTTPWTMPISRILKSSRPSYRCTVLDCNIASRCVSGTLPPVACPEHWAMLDTVDEASHLLRRTIQKGPCNKLWKLNRRFSEEWSVEQKFYSTPKVESIQGKPRLTERSRPLSRGKHHISLCTTPIHSTVAQ